MTQFIPPRVQPDLAPHAILADLSAFFAEHPEGVRIPPGFAQALSEGLRDLAAWAKTAAELIAVTGHGPVPLAPAPAPSNVVPFPGRGGAFLHGRS